MLIKSYVCVYLFGNAVHERLIPLLSNKELPVSYNSGIVFVRDEKDAIASESTEFNVFQSDCVPYNTQLIVLPNDKTYVDIQPNVTDSIFFVEDWTFLNNEGLEMAKQYRRDYPYNELRILLFNSNRKTLSTDATNAQTALDDAVFEYEQEGFSVTIVQQHDISNLFFWKNRKYQDMLKRDFKEKLHRAKSSFENNFELKYKVLSILLNDGMLHPDSLDRLTCYDEKLGSKKIELVIDNAIQVFYHESSQFMVEINDIMSEFTNEICLWDYAKVFDKLVEIFTYQFKRNMELSLPKLNINKVDEISYNRFMHDTKFNVIFVQCSNNFFSDTAKSITKSYIENIFKKMEEFYE